jgi:hypothetical protein
MPVSEIERELDQKTPGVSPPVIAPGYDLAQVS